MPDYKVYEYAIIRFVPQVEREEFVNLGVILYCRDLKFLDIRHQLPLKKLAVFCPEISSEWLEKQMDSWINIALGHPEGGPIATLLPAERFRWLTAKRSSVIQVSTVHPGICRDARQTLEYLFEQLVL
jgi:hypothetical protein